MLPVLVLVEFGWLGAGLTWLAHYYHICPVDQAKNDVMLGELFVSMLLQESLII